MSVSSALGSKFPMPIGAILPYLGQSPPSSFLVCDGTTYDISQYPLLFEALSTYYGGDGITTFSVPDLTLAFISGTAQNTSPPTTTASGGSFSGLFNLGSISTANLPANIPINPPLNDPSLANNFQGQIGYTNGVVKFAGNFHSPNNNTGGAENEYFTYAGSASASLTPQWNITTTGAFGTYINVPVDVVGSITNISGNPSYYSMSYIIKATPN
jgi:microcystin-dependent protein